MLLDVLQRRAERNVTRYLLFGRVSCAARVSLVIKCDRLKFSRKLMLSISHSESGIYSKASRAAE